MKQLVAVGMMCVVACGGSPKPAPAPAVANKPAPAPAPAPAPPAPAAPMSEAEFEAMMNQAVVMFDRMAAAADAAGGDCHKLSLGYTRALDDSQDFIASAKRWQDAPGMDKRTEEWMTARMDAMMPNLVKIGTAATTCAGDPEFAVVMKRFDELK